MYRLSGLIVVVELRAGQQRRIEQKEAEGELQLVVALVPEDLERMITLRRLLAIEARQDKWHDADVHHMQNLGHSGVTA